MKHLSKLDVYQCSECGQLFDSGGMKPLPDLVATAVRLSGKDILTTKGFHRDIKLRCPICIHKNDPAGKGVGEFRPRGRKKL